MGDDLVVEWRAFPLRPEPDPSARFKGTYREEGWRRCGAMAEADGIRFTPWPREDFADWSLPALELAKCAARQGPEAFDWVHLRLYEAFFTRSVNIARRDELLELVRQAPLDLDRLGADLDGGAGRAAVMADYQEAIERHGVRAIPTLIVESGQRLTGLADLATYRKTLASR
jgi:predicted DsbA family dithiol-disulfide isomerase